MASSTNLNTEVLAALTRLEDTISRLNDRDSSSPQDNIQQPDTTDSSTKNSIEEITQDASNISLSSPSLLANNTPPLEHTHITHYKTQPPSLIEAYTLLSTASQYIHATSTKYTLVSKIDYQTQGGNLALELRKGIELLSTATLSIYSPESGCGRSVKRYVKQYSRGVLASVISLLQAFHDGEALIGGKENQVGPQKTGAVWSACDALQQLPKGNRNAMRRECMTWLRDCMESITEFEDMMNNGEREEVNDDGDYDGDYEEEMYTAKEKIIVKAAINVMKCSKNVLGLVLKACDCVGDLSESDCKEHTQTQRLEMLQWISQLHELAREIGESVTNFGVLLYPPLDLESDAKTSEFTLAKQLICQLERIEHCVSYIYEPCMPISKMSIKSCMSEEVVEAVEKLKNGVKARTAEVQSAMVLS